MYLEKCKEMSESQSRIFPLLQNFLACYMFKNIKKKKKIKRAFILILRITLQFILFEKEHVYLAFNFFVKRNSFEQRINKNI